MYKITIDGELVYSPAMAREGYTVIEPKIIKEKNAAGSCEMKIPVTNPRYDEVRKMKSVVQVFDGEKEVFRGRCVKIEKDFRRNKYVYFEGCLAYLLDTTIHPYSYTNIDIGTYIRNLLSNHNVQMEDLTKRIWEGNILVSGVIEKAESMEYPSTMQEIQKKILDVYGGAIKTRYTDGRIYLDYYNDESTYAIQTIEFGKNLIDIDESISCENIYTAIIPLGKSYTDGSGTTRYLDITSVNGSPMIVDGNAVNAFGFVTKTVKFPDIDNAVELYDRGYMELQKNIKEAVSVRISAIDMHLLNPEIEALDIGDSVRIKSIQHGIDDVFPCTHLVANLSEPEKSSYTFGEIRRTITGRK